MKIKLKTLQVQAMVSKAVKGSSNNKLIPITWLIAIELKNNKLTFTTTDATNILKVYATDVVGDDFYATVQCDLFSKLVGKITSDEITMEVVDGGLEIIGNGRYTLEIPLDEEGRTILLKDKKTSWETDTKAKFDLATIKTLVEVNKVSLAKTMEVPCLTGYYMHDKVLTTNSIKVCCLNKPVFDNPVLLPGELVNLLEVINKEPIVVRQSNKYIEFGSEGVIITGAKLADIEIENYPVAGIDRYLKTEFPSVCKLSKTALSSVLDRLILFISPYDKNSINLTFSEKGLQINSKQLTGVEIIPYTSSEKITPFTCSVNIELLQPQVSAISDENIELHFGNESAIKIVSGDITQITALSSDE